MCIVELFCVDNKEIFYSSWEYWERSTGVTTVQTLLFNCLSILTYLCKLTTAFIPNLPRDYSLFRARMLQVDSLYILLVL